MTKREILDLLVEDFSAADIRDVARILRDDYEYEGIKTSHSKEDLCDELETLVSKQDLVEVLNANYEGWDESDDDSDDDEKGEEAE
jgi:hypothetical protein